jgi:hypothetical protein
MPGAESDLELLAEEKVLEEETLVAAEKAGESGDEEPEKSDHPAGSPILTVPRGPAHVPLQLDARAFPQLDGRQPD